MKYDVYYHHRGNDHREAFRKGVDRKTMLSNRRYLIKSKVVPVIMLGEVEIEVTDDDK